FLGRITSLPSTARIGRLSEIGILEVISLKSVLKAWCLILNKNQKQTSQVFLNHCLLTIGFKIDQSNSRITS
uniref:hypothetical protein n=1 Tax=Streptococcus suis TaxID=1307 RepID=UPI002AAB75E1